MKKALFGLAKSQDQALGIVKQLNGAGFSDADISVPVNNTGARHLAHLRRTRAPEGMAVGAGVGLVIGAVLGWLPGIGVLAIPGIAPFLAADPIMAALAVEGIGATVGGFVGALVGMEMPQFKAVQYQAKMDGGNILISVLTADANERRRVKEIFKNAGSVTAAEAVVDHAYGRPARTLGAAMTAPAGKSAATIHARP